MILAAATAKDMMSDMFLKMVWQIFRPLLIPFGCIVLAYVAIRILCFVRRA